MFHVKQKENTLEKNHHYLNDSFNVIFDVGV